MMTPLHRLRNDARGGRHAVYALVAFLAGACATPAPAPVPAGIPLRVMTYNIRSGNGDLAGTAAAIRAEHPDVVALQEVDVHWAPRSAYVDQATELGQRLGMQVRFAPIYVIADPGMPSSSIPSARGTSRPPREFGVALLSRFPIVAFANDTITRLSTQVETPVPTPMPGLLDAVLDVHGMRVHVLNTHLDYRRDPAARATQVREMIARVDTTVPTLVFGDMNASPSAPELQPLLALLHDVLAGRSSELTYPADAPTARDDYVLTSSHFRLRDAAVPATQASDHRPVVASLELERGITP